MKRLTNEQRRAVELARSCGGRLVERRPNVWTWDRPIDNGESVPGEIVRELLELKVLSRVTSIDVILNEPKKYKEIKFK